MKRLYPFIILLLSLVIFASSVSIENVKPYYTADIAISDEGDILLANKGSQELRMISTEGELLKSWKLPNPATGVVTVGKRAYVTSSKECGFLSCIELEGNFQTLYTTQTGMGACAPVISHDGKKIYVCNRYKSTISEVDASTGELLRETKVLREPCAATLSADGKTLFVNNFLPSQPRTM